MGRDNRFILAAVFLIVISIVLVTLLNSEKSHNKVRCELYDQILQESFSDIITRKFKNPNSHLRPTIEVHEKIIDIHLDTSGFFEFVIVGDSLVKESGNPKICIYRDGKFIKEFTLDYECNNLNE